MMALAGLLPQKLSPWSEERIELLKTLHRKGDSFSQIAAQLGGGITRNAAIGKAKRIGLPDRCRSAVQRQPYKMSDYFPGARPEAAKPAKDKIDLGLARIVLNILKQARETPAAEGKPISAPHKPKAVAPKPVSQALVLTEPAPHEGRYTVLDISSETCKWPIGDVLAKDFCFCGHPPRENSPYCEYHARAAYQPMQDRRHRSFG